jgi:hypothetical protein
MNWLVKSKASGGSRALRQADPQPPGLFLFLLWQRYVPHLQHFGDIQGKLTMLRVECGSPDDAQSLQRLLLISEGIRILHARDNL